MPVNRQTVRELSRTTPVSYTHLMCIRDRHRDFFAEM